MIEKAFSDRERNGGFDLESLEFLKREDIERYEFFADMGLEGVL